VPESVIERLEEAVRLCDAAIARLEHDPNPGGSVLLEEMKAIRRAQVEQIERLRQRFTRSQVLPAPSD
jgi:hypothetical protein